MKALILAGGLGTYLRGIIDNIPKPMVSVANRPFLEYIILQLKRHGIIDITGGAIKLAENYVFHSLLEVAGFLVKKKHKSYKEKYE